MCREKKMKRFSFSSREQCGSNKSKLTISNPEVLLTYFKTTMFCFSIRNYITVWSVICSKIVLNQTWGFICSRIILKITSCDVHRPDILAVRIRMSSFNRGGVRTHESFLYLCDSLALARATWHMAPCCKFIPKHAVLYYPKRACLSTDRVMGQSILDWCSLIFYTCSWHSFQRWRWKRNVPESLECCTVKGQRDM